MSYQPYDFLGHFWDTPITELLSHFGLQYRGHGEKIKAHCPFCGDDRGWHLNINGKKGVFNCFRCGTGGGVMDFYALMTRGRKYNKAVDQGVMKTEMLEALYGSIAADSYGNQGTLVAVRTKREQLKKRYEEAGPTDVPVAPDEKLHAIYKALLSFPAFKLSANHRASLLKRGLNAEAIETNEYRTVPTNVKWDNEEDALRFFNSEIEPHLEKDPYKELANKPTEDLILGLMAASHVTALGLDPLGVPGFFQIGDAWCVMLFPGMLVPTRNIHGQIVGLQTRTDRGDIRYLTMSSKDYPCGATEGIARTHFPLACKMNSRAIQKKAPETLGDSIKEKLGFGAKVDPKSTVVGLTEGPLKADVAMFLSDNRMPIMALQGVYNRKDLPAVFEELKKRGFTTIQNLLDMDKCTNPNVAKASRELRKLVEENGLEMTMFCWDPQYAKKKYDELKKIAKKVNLPVKGNDDIFVALGSLSNALSAKGVSHSVAIGRDGHKVKVYWRKETKGIDDYLLLLHQKKAEKKPF